jgi:hypothetical protein
MKIMKLEQAILPNPCFEEEEEEEEVSFCHIRLLVKKPQVRVPRY